MTAADSIRMDHQFSHILSPRVFSTIGLRNVVLVEWRAITSCLRLQHREIDIITTNFHIARNPIYLLFLMPSRMVANRTVLLRAMELSAETRSWRRERNAIAVLMTMNVLSNAAIQGSLLI